MTNDELHQRLQLLEVRINTVTSLQGQRIARLERQRAAEQEPLALTYEPADIKDFRVSPNPPGRRELLARIQVLELRMDSQEGRLSRLVLRVAARERRAKVANARATSGREVTIDLEKTMGFRIDFTVNEMTSAVPATGEYDPSRGTQNEAMVPGAQQRPRPAWLCGVGVEAQAWRYSGAEA